MNGRHLNILFVEDSEPDYITTRDLLAEIKEWQFNLERVSTYEAAVDKLSRNSYDICLLNYQLSRRNGMDVLPGVVEHDKTPPLILLTTAEDRPGLLRLLKPGSLIT